ncbi:MAG: UvrD-helicase domain-containing protein [Oscillospiraceae bacterium]|nr:UvrD-helicase domain-containing protein [Oscillospiraceae bacterium]
MAEKLTVQQEMAISNRGGKLLVSAAAGSGKTKVLVDRLLSYLTDPVDPADLDEFLIITYTKAAAAELRGKIANKLTQCIAENPENRHLQKQLQRLYLTKISTVHSFCTDILREYAYQLDIMSDFRVADENEAQELRAYAMQHILDEAYAQIQTDEDLSSFVNTQGFGRDDRQIPNIVYKVYNSARCHLNPEAWLDWCVQINNNTAIKDASETIWGKYLIDDLHRYLDLQIKSIENTAKTIMGQDYMEKPSALLWTVVDQLTALRKCDTWEDIRAHMEIEYGRLVFSPKCADLELKEQIKSVREACKKGLAKKLRRFSMRTEQIVVDIAMSQAATRGLIELTRRFDSAYTKLKRGRRVLDFGDLEHKTLDLLLGKSRSGITQIANEISNRFREVMVDEYQDSNAVQDAIFEALTDKKQNCFMVGDVKQSIYQFRLADPGIFLKKYDTYVPAEEAEVGQGRKILLSSNFRSSGGVIQAVNDVFSTCMSRQVGGLEYGEEERLKEGIPHIPLEEQELELYALEAGEDKYATEANFVAQAIAQLLDGTHMIRQDGGLRPITADDIVILLRSPGSVGTQYQFALQQRGIRCVCGGGTDLLKCEEVEVLCSFLQIVSNPLQDIPLLSVLSSRIIGFTADELAEMRYHNKAVSIFEALQGHETEKAKSFLALLDDLRRQSQLISLTQLIMQILSVTHMDSVYAALPDGFERVENLQSFCRYVTAYEQSVCCGLSHFLEHLEILQERGLETSSEDSTTDAVRIMSIHKSKGLEFPVVFLCGLSKEFNKEDIRAQVLCDKELGLGLSGLDTVNRVRYPTIAKHAISAKMLTQNISEELRVLYVAMTRARDRLIMTYTLKNVSQGISELSYRAQMGDLSLISEDADSPGVWVLLTALKHKSDGWCIRYSPAEDCGGPARQEDVESVAFQVPVHKLRDALAFQYPFALSTQSPSKQTATQIKGRIKDIEASENTDHTTVGQYSWRKPAFIEKSSGGITYGNAMHTVMQYIRYDACGDYDSIKGELSRLVKEKYISEELKNSINAQTIADLFSTELGMKLRMSQNVLREFKFSILDDASNYCPGVGDEKIMLQGVVDCAIIEPDGIIVIDFKTDRINDETVTAVSQGYCAQITTYAKALEKIYRLPVKAAFLYYFHMGKFIPVI